MDNQTVLAVQSLLDGQGGVPPPDPSNQNVPGTTTTTIQSMAPCPRPPPTDRGNVLVSDDVLLFRHPPLTPSIEQAHGYHAHTRPEQREHARRGRVLPPAPPPPPSPRQPPPLQPHPTHPPPQPQPQQQSHALPPGQPTQQALSLQVPALQVPTSLTHNAVQVQVYSTLPPLAGGGSAEIHTLGLQPFQSVQPGKQGSKTATLQRDRPAWTGPGPLLPKRPRGHKKTPEPGATEQLKCKGPKTEVGSGSHTGEKPFQCIVCGRAFAQKSNVKKHMQTHKVWPLGMESSVFRLPITVKVVPVPTNEETEGGEKQQQQQEQEEEVSGQQNSQSQIEREDEEQSRTGTDRRYSKGSSRDVAPSLQAAPAPLGLGLGPAETQQGEGEQVGPASPQQGARKETPVYRCMKCQSKYSTQDALEQHLMTASHNFPCPHCQKVFPCERYFRRHLPTHGVGGRFKCPTCKKAFKTEHYLKLHARIHSGEKPFKCSLCEASFNRKDKVKRHMLIHEPFKKYKCPFRSSTLFFYLIRLIDV
ncbi:hypothetical protein CRUP_010815 [Coryphaenoides rupestris]|nr:hypothetical protein CRUP_010815 [Coryphaenoides rupestris]